MALELVVEAKNFALPDGQQRKVLENFSLRAPQAGKIALFGPSGCGKSTILRLVAGIDRDFSGFLRGVAAPIGMVFQEPRLLPWRSVADNLALAAPKLSREKILELLDAFELGDHGADFPGQLSLGLARRVALARAFAVSPKLVLLDEPFASLDMGLHRRLREKIAEKLAETGASLLIATHDLDDALLLADEILFLHPAPNGVARRFVLPEKFLADRLTHLAELRAAVGEAR